VARGRGGFLFLKGFFFSQQARGSLFFSFFSPVIKRPPPFDSPRPFSRTGGVFFLFSLWVQL